MRRNPDHLAPNATRSKSPAHRRGAFTLIELMIVIVVIAILMALVLPAITSVRRSAQVSQVAMEIKNIEQAIAGFKLQYGIEPPSSITLMEQPSQMSATDQAVIRRLWPRFNFAANTYDWNGNGMGGQMGVGVTLNGAECLVFFLGGMRGVDPVTNAPNSAMTGFSKNPANPFIIQSGNGESRDGPFYDFKVNRLVQSANNSNFLVYIDPLPGHAVPYAPYFYASSNDGRGYNPTDLYNGASGTRLQDVYCLSTEDVNSDRILNMGEDLNSNGRLDISYLNPKTFQIISPGFDHTYGIGKTYQQDRPNGALTNKADYDNLTNFRSTMLKP